MSSPYSGPLPPIIPPGNMGPPGPPMANPIIGQVAGEPTLGQEVVALGFLIVIGFLLPPPWGIRFALIVLAGYFLTSAKHQQDLSGIIQWLDNGLTGLQRGAARIG